MPKQVGEKKVYVHTPLSDLWRQARAQLTAAIRAEETGAFEAAQGYLRMVAAAIVAPAPVAQA